MTKLQFHLFSSVEDMFSCPFCGRLVTVGVDEAFVPSVVHGTPGCEQYRELPAREFLNRALQAKSRVKGTQ